MDCLTRDYSRSMCVYCGRPAVTLSPILCGDCAGHNEPTNTSLDGQRPGETAAVCFGGGGPDPDADRDRAAASEVDR